MSRTAKDFAIQLFTEIPPYNFRYDFEKQLFRIGDDSVELNEFHDYYIEPQEPISRQAAAALIDESALVIMSSDDVHMMPRLNKWISGMEIDTLQTLMDQATNVLMTSYAELLGTDEQKLLKGSHWGFGAEFIRPGHPIFTVLGDCACYGVGLYGTFGPEEWGSGFASFDFHNIDWPAQRVSLMAGLGTMASLCIDSPK